MNDLINIINSTQRLVVFYCHSMGHIFDAYRLFANSSKKKNEICFVITTVDKTDTFRHINICKRLNDKGIKSYFFDKKTRIHRLIGISDCKNIMLKRRLEKDNDTSHGILMINYCWNQQFICYPASFLFRFVNECIFIEEGAAQYTTPTDNRFTIMLKELYGNKRYFWNDRKTKGIYVRFPQKYNEIIKPFLSQYKVGIDNSDINDYVDIFLGSKKDEWLQLYEPKPVGIIFTQPFSEDGYMSENEKIEMYHQLLAQHIERGKIVLKVHPRDKSDYSKISEYVDDYEYPSELLCKSDLIFDFAIGISTSAIYSVNALYRENVDEFFLQKRRKVLR